MEKLTENMIRWAESKLGSTEYAGWCLAFIEDALEISNQIEIYGGDSAKESCEMYNDALQGGVPERGAFVFYDCMCPSETVRSTGALRRQSRRWKSDPCVGHGPNR